MAVAYEESGRTAQKQRTREALVGAARALLARGVAPTIEETAQEASVSRATAYRYFPDRDALLMAAYPQIEASSLLGDDPPDDPEERLGLVLDDIGRQLVTYETELRATWRVSLDPEGAEPGRVPLRAGRAIGWIENALEPLKATHSKAEIHRLAIAIRACFGIESLVWCLDVAGLTRAQALEVMRETALTRLRAALR